MSERFAAWGFDGRTAEARPARLRVEVASLLVESEDGERAMPIASLRISEAFDAAPCSVCTAAGESFQVEDGRGFARVLEAAGFRASPVVRLQRHSAAAAGAVALLVAALVYGYLSGIPALARRAARETPHAAQQRIGDELLSLLDESFLEPSELSEDERASIAARFLTAADIAAPGRAVRLEFRRHRNDPPLAEVRDAPEDEDDARVDHGMVNAFSLPGGTIILLDGLVTVAEPDQVFAVLGHELGHVVLDHSMQSFYRSAGVATLASLAWGDFSGVAASVPAVFGMLRYSRGLESEADDFAIRFLTLERLSPDALCDFFELVLEVERTALPGGFPEFLSTHPDPRKRIARLCPESASSAASSP